MANVGTLSHKILKPSSFLAQLVSALEERFATRVGSPGNRMVVNYSTIRQSSNIELIVALEQGGVRIADFTNTSAVIYNKIWYDQIVEQLEKVRAMSARVEKRFTVYSINLHN